MALSCSAHGRACTLIEPETVDGPFIVWHPNLGRYWPCTAPIGALLTLTDTS